MYRRKRLITKRRIFTIAIVLVIFVMSLGYAALSQYVELDGIASIDRSWIVKVTKVTNTVTNSATSISSNYVSNTVTLNANLPTSSSTITYTITLSNQGNIPAKLNNIEIVEDENSNITYEISGVEEEVTTLAPGETNTAKVTIKYKSGVTNISETKKELMLTFIYIDNSKPSSSGGSSGGTEEEEYEVFKVGEKVELIDGTIWYVTKNSSSSEDKVTLVSENTVSSNGSVSTNGTYTKAFDSNNTNEYDQFDTNNIGYYVKNTVETYIKNSIKNSGGNITGTTARLLTKEEYDDLIKEEVPSWMEGSYWLMSNEKGNNGYYFNGTSVVSTSSFTSSYRVRPVIITLKSNVEKPIYLKDQILEDNVERIDSNIDFSQMSEWDGTKGLYYTSENTEDNKITYYFRGAVENNYVYFAGYYWRIIRINEDGSVRLIYQGETPNATGSAATIGSSAFNSSSNDNAYVGYMYGYPETTTKYGDVNQDGKVNTSDMIIVRNISLNVATPTEEQKVLADVNMDGKIDTEDVQIIQEYMINYDLSTEIDILASASEEARYQATHKNVHDSAIKDILDTWYEDNLISYSSYLEDSGFCGDRSVANEAGLWYSNDTALGYGKNYTYYGASYRLTNINEPQFSCPQNNDLYTTSNSTQGNQSLDYPIGLITADEVVFAGSIYQGGGNMSYYLYTGSKFWTMSPDNITLYDRNFYLDELGDIYATTVGSNSEMGIRPVINLKAETEIIKGSNGSSSNPYVIA